tara:strand:- start:16349 stop:19057 length:2709 start_codon:yes stop_codon:yes gene_type:complete
MDEEHKEGNEEDHQEEPIVNPIKDKKDQKFNFIQYFKSNKNWIIFLILILIVIFGFNIRTNNINLLTDSVTGDKTPLALDPYSFLRYAQQIVETGSVEKLDGARYFPFGYETNRENIFVSYFIAYLFKFMNFFNSDLTLNHVDVLYPPIAFSIGLIFFFLLVRKIFDYRIALLASFLLTVIPTFLYRTMAGFSDKEALATMFMFMALYFFFSAWKSKNFRNSMILAVLAGISNGLMALSWGGVQFIYVSIGLFMLVVVLLGKLTKRHLIVYTIWMVFTFGVTDIFSGRYNVLDIINSTSSGIAILAFVSALLSYFIYDKNLLNVKEKLEKYPRALVLILLTVIITFIAGISIKGLGFFYKEIYETLYYLSNPFGRTRWALTVAESHQPYIRDWIGNFGLKYVMMFIIGSVVLFYQLIKPIKFKYYKWGLTLLYTLFIFSFIFSRYSSDSIFNGTNTLSKFMYLGSISIFGVTIIGLYLFTFYKQKNIFENFKKINETIIFVFFWFLLMIVAARSAVRLLFILSPLTTVMTSFLIFWLFDKAKLLKNVYKIASYVLIILIVLIPFSISSSFALGILDIGIIPRFTQSTLDSSRNLGPSYNLQWQQATKWIREETPKDSVFVHWWDYGYWVQYGGERATLSDGGNAIPAINHFIGRHVLTAQSEDEALEFVKSRGGDYLLMINDEIGKYTAFSSIGSDVNYDRYSWINTFILNEERQEEDGVVTLLYTGGTALDDSFEYNGRTFPAGEAGIAGFFVPTRFNEVGGIDFNRPFIVLVYQNQQFVVPLNCLYVEGKLIDYGEDGLDGCLRVIPTFIDGNTVNQIGAALYLSPDVRKSLFAQLYLFDKQTPNFELVYNDEDSLPLAVFNGRIIGPIKIWKINIPDYIKENPIYKGLELPDPRVQEVR